MSDPTMTDGGNRPIEAPEIVKREERIRPGAVAEIQRLGQEMADTELRERLARTLWDHDEAEQEKSEIHDGRYRREIWDEACSHSRDEYRRRIDVILSDAATAGYVIVKLEGTVNEGETPRMKPEPPEVVA